MTKNKTEYEPPPQFVLLRGLGRESRHWGEFPTALKSELAAIAEVPAERLNIDAVDLPGTGKFSEMRSPISISEIADFVRAKYVTLRQNRRNENPGPMGNTYLVAVSLGGMVATEWLRHWPNDFSGCVLINTSFRGYSSLTQRLKPTNWLALAHVLRVNDAFERERAVLKLISNRAEKRETTARDWAKISLSRPISNENFTRQLLAAARFRAASAAPRIPTLVVASEADRFVDPACSRAIADRWHVPMITHPDAGHDLSLDEPKWLAHEIAKWWKKTNALSV